jgi:hypothetical protein
MRKTVALIVAASVVALAPAAANPASAGKPAPSGSSSVTLDQAGPHVVGNVVTFSPSTTATEKPWEQLTCYQGVTLVLNESHPDYWPNALNDPGEFALGPTDLWQQGGADCVATLQMNTKRGMRTLATLSFSVAG